MAPPIPSHLKRFTANVAKPAARYRPGKVVQEESSDEVEDESEEEQKQQVQKSRVTSQQNVVQRSHQPTQQRQRQEEVEDDDEEGFVTEDEGAGVVLPKPAADSARTQSKSYPPQSDTKAQVKVEFEEGEEQEDSEADESDESEGEESSSLSSSSSADETTQRKFLRPTFVKKSDRTETTSIHTTHVARPSTTPAPEIVSSTTSRAASERRLEQATLLIKDTIEKDTLARLAGKKNWDDEELAPEALVDDTDNIDPEAEYSAWRLREFHRLKRDREQLIAREKELEEIERRRNLSQTERDAEDQAYLDRQRAEKEGKGHAAVLARYHHKGAFFMDDETSRKMAQRDLMGARFADDVVDKTTLPEYMRVRDMTKLGKKGRTRYKDLKGEDTGHFGDEVKRWRGSGSGYEHRPPQGREDFRNVDERFRPDGHDSRNGSGANNIEIGARRSRIESNREKHENRDRSRSRRRSRSRSSAAAYSDDDSNDYKSARNGTGRRRRRSRSQSGSRSDSLSRQASKRSKRRSRSPSSAKLTDHLDRDRHKDRENGRDKRRRIEV